MSDPTVRNADAIAAIEVRYWLNELDASGTVELYDSNRSTLVHLIAALSPADEDAGADDWSWFTGQRQLEISHYSPVYGDDDDQSYEWRVHRQHGSINDREWDLVGSGETALEAVQNARKALTPTETGEQGRDG